MAWLSICFALDPENGLRWAIPPFKFLLNSFMRSNFNMLSVKITTFFGFCLTLLLSGAPIFSNVFLFCWNRFSLLTIALLLKWVIYGCLFEMLKWVFMACKYVSVKFWLCCRFRILPYSHTFFPLSHSFLFILLVLPVSSVIFLSPLS